MDDLVALLQNFEIRVLADVRTVPRSRHNPQFDATMLSAYLPARSIHYVHVPALGGLRHSRNDSINRAWRNASFRGYADYMQTDAFEVGLAELRTLATDGAIALMCAEAVPWRCHRSLVADALRARGATVEHIMAKGRSSPHRITSFARVAGTHVTYPG